MGQWRKVLEVVCSEIGEEMGTEFLGGGSVHGRHAMLQGAAQEVFEVIRVTLSRKTLWDAWRGILGAGNRVSKELHIGQRPSEVLGIETLHPGGGQTLVLPKPHLHSLKRINVGFQLVLHVFK